MTECNNKWNGDIRGNFNTNCVNDFRNTGISTLERWGRSLEGHLTGLKEFHGGSYGLTWDIFKLTSDETPWMWYQVIILNKEQSWERGQSQRWKFKDDIWGTPFKSSEWIKISKCLGKRYVMWVTYVIKNFSLAILCEQCELCEINFKTYFIWPNMSKFNNFSI